MAEALIQILIVIFSVLLLGGIIWTLFWRNPRKLSSRRLAAIDAANARRHDAPADRVDLTSADIINLSKASASETNMRANKVSADGVNLKDAGAIKRLSVRPFLFWLERFFISCESLWFDQDFIYVFDGQELAARYKFEQILTLEVTKIRINHARIWRICFADGASELKCSSTNKPKRDGASEFKRDGANIPEQDGAQNFTNDEFINSVRIPPSNSKILRKHIGASEIETDANKSDENAASEYKFVPAASIFEPRFKEFLQILRKKNREAIKTEPRFWEAV